MKKSNSLRRFIESLFSMRYLALFVALILLLVGALAVLLGIKHLYISFLHFFVYEDGKPGIHLIHTIDSLLFSIVILVLSGGVYKLFVGNQETFKNNSVLANVKSFRELKILLWETILLTLTIWAALDFFQESKFTTAQLILPGSILLLAIALSVMKGGFSSKKRDDTK